MPFAAKQLVAATCVVVVASLGYQRGGWLARLVEYRKAKFLQDLDRLPPVQIEAKFEQAPPGYVDSKAWDYVSVVRLLALLRQSETTRPLSRALRRVLSPATRRIMMNKRDSYKYFPALHNPNIYYDSISMETYEDPDNLSDEYTERLSNHTLIVISNPVEARLPSAQISVMMLKEIMENRASAGREMPITSKKPIPWKPMNKPSTVSGNATTTADDGNSTSTTNVGVSETETTASDATNEVTENTTASVDEGKEAQTEPSEAQTEPSEAQTEPSEAQTEPSGVRRQGK